ncbi:uncharacterized protein LOC127880275 [Dreissena polymorpha]|uniref:Uncharacterized protein n=1 Tax=Dreissena polymorpha TaxID=45954 RepID=A0A9D4MSE6_DREPO|nr:uncharacterized protein LOC127880275 [Dreissena polymorpha]XP_052283591.1 uncharacterized protein LOC127880275 [Dreissena polymorpha]KAH3881365.1 hypothetical protein DPMN_005290 [Dreissena polymorpha]
MVISVGTTDSEKKVHADCTSTPGNGAQQSKQGIHLSPPHVDPSHSSLPFPVGQQVHFPSNESFHLGSRASTVQCDEILSNGELAYHGGERTDARPYGPAYDSAVRYVTVGESDKQRRPVDTSQNDEYLRSFIKSVVKEQIQGAKPEKRKHFDSVIVYDKRDYEQVMFYKNQMEDIMSQSDVKEPVRIELYDSEQFLQSSVRVIDDVISKSSVIFVLLSVHSDTRQINFFCEEAVARLHIDPSNQSSFGAANAFDSPLKCIIKPLQTVPSSRRMYPIPPGLMSITSIDIFDYTSSFTRDKIISTLREAINTRIRQEDRDNTKREFSYMHRLTAGSEAPRQYSSHLMYPPAFIGDAHLNGGLLKSTDATTAFVRSSLGHHHQAFYEERRSPGGVANGSSTFIRPLSNNHHHNYQVFNGDKHTNFGVANGSTAHIRLPPDVNQSQIPQTFYAEQIPYVQMRVPPASPESEPNPMELLPPYFASPAPNQDTRTQNGENISEQRHQPLLQHALYTPNQRKFQIPHSPEDRPGHTQLTTLQMTNTNPKKADDIQSRQFINVQHNEKPEQTPYDNEHSVDDRFSTDALRSTFSSASVLGNQHSSLIHRRQYIPPFQELLGLSISHDALSSNDLNSDDLEIDQGMS